ncbi:FtsH protease activity modulator HflK [bacterium]|nr:MAG: FtsH protease activity modulator HflK [bacterium]
MTIAGLLAKLGINIGKYNAHAPVIPETEQDIFTRAGRATQRPPNKQLFFLLNLSLWKIGFGIILAWSLLTCWIITAKDENAVVTRFGKHVRTSGPGLNFKAPWPIEVAEEVSVQKIMRIEIGFKTNDKGKEEEVAHENNALSKDLNIVKLDYVVQYRIADAAKWLFEVADPEEATKRNAQSAMRTVAGGSTFDELATTGRSQVQEEAERVLRELCDMMDFGVEIVGIQLQDVHPPNEVMAAFQDVNNALENKGQAINNAQGYMNEQLPKAKGEAQSILEEAAAYKQQRINYATGDVARFLEVLKEYQQNPELTTARLRYETMEKVMPGKEQYVVRDQGTLRLMNLNK